MYFRVCNECGCMSWNESQTKTTSTYYWIDKDLKLREEDNNSDLLDGDVITTCNECDNEDMQLIDSDNLTKEEFKRIINMEDEERLEWLKKYLVIQGLK